MKEKNFKNYTYVIIGFDCGSNQSNITTLSLLEVGECDLPQSQVHVERTYIQLLQLTRFSNTKVKQSKVENRRAKFLLWYALTHFHSCKWP